MYFLGDVVLDKVYKIEFELDDFIFNLEYPLSCKGIPAKNKINLCQDKSYIEETFGKLPLAVNLANNHIMDYGEEAFAKTIEYLDSKGIKYFGAGNKKNNFNNPCILNQKGKRIALFGYSCASTHAVFGSDVVNGSAIIDVDDILKEIRRHKNNVDMIILNFHWGDEDVHYPKASDVNKARVFVDAGADLIIGHHAHVVQSFEVYKGKHIFYGLGNFIFQYHDVPSKYNGQHFEEIHSSKNKKKNNETLFIELNKKLDVKYKTALYTGKSLKEKKIYLPRWIPKTNKQYAIYRKYWEKKEMLTLFLKNPRVPSLKQIKLFLGLKVK